MRAASAIGFAGPPCCCQYCITMAMLAAPQPSFSCFTNGTSSQRLGGSPAKSTPQTPSIRTTVLITRGGMGLPSTRRHDDQNESCDGHYDDNQVAVAASAAGKAGPRPGRP